MPTRPGWRLSRRCHGHGRSARAGRPCRDGYGCRRNPASTSRPAASTSAVSAGEFWCDGGDLAAGNADIDRRRRRPDLGITEDEIEGGVAQHGRKPSGSRPGEQPQIVCNRAAKLFKICACNSGERVAEPGKRRIAHARCSKTRSPPDVGRRDRGSYLTASMIPDPEAAAAYMKPGHHHHLHRRAASSITRGGRPVLTRGAIAG